MNMGGLSIPSSSVEDDWELIAQEPRNLRSHQPALEPAREGVTDTSKTATRVHASILIPGKGNIARNQTIIANGGKIVYIGAPNGVPPKYANIKARSVRVLMPGLWECHAHFVGGSPNKAINVLNLAFTNPAEAGARNVRALRDTLYAGYTSCVDLGGYAPELQKVMDEGLILGPTLYGTGAGISMTAGHADAMELPLGLARYRQSILAPGADTTSTFVTADGVDECLKAVRSNLRRGARVTKVMTSGGVTSLSDDPLLAQFSPLELRTIVEESSRMNLTCSAHAIGKPGIVAALQAGFKVIEHGSYLDTETINLMLDKSAILVATLTPLHSILDNPQSYPATMYEKLRRMVDRHFASYRAAIKAGVTCALGSDLFGGPTSVLGPGQNGKEVGYAVEAGMSARQAIESATANGPLTLGLQAPKSGRLGVGWDADFIAVDIDDADIDLDAKVVGVSLGVGKGDTIDAKLADRDTKVFEAVVKAVGTPEKVTHVWKGGRLVKGPGVDYWDVLAEIAAAS